MRGGEHNRKAHQTKHTSIEKEFERGSMQAVREQWVGGGVTNHKKTKQKRRSQAHKTKAQTRSKKPLGTASSCKNVATM